MLNFEGCREKDGSGYPFVFFFRKQKIVADSLTRRARPKVIHNSRFTIHH